MKHKQAGLPDPVQVRIVLLVHINGATIKLSKIDWSCVKQSVCIVLLSLDEIYVLLFR